MASKRIKSKPKADVSLLLRASRHHRSGSRYLEYVGVANMDKSKVNVSPALTSHRDIAVCPGTLLTARLDQSERLSDGGIAIVSSGDASKAEDTETHLVVGAHKEDAGIWPCGSVLYMPRFAGQSIRVGGDRVYLQKASDVKAWYGPEDPNMVRDDTTKGGLREE